jgi:hypothetical protein
MGKKSEEQGEVLTALELVDADLDDGVGPGLIPRYQVYREAERGNGIGAAINRAYTEAEQQGQCLSVLTAIGPARNGKKLGDLLASPALDSVQEAMRASMVGATEQLAATVRASMVGATEQLAATVRASISSFAVDVAEHITREMTASLSELPRLMLGNEAFESLGRASMGESAIEIIRGAGITGGISSAMSLASVMDRQREQALQSINDFARNYATEQAAISRRMNEQLTRYSSALMAEQQQRQETMLAAFADVDRWQRRWEVHEPEPPAEQIEVVQTHDQLTLESIAMALKQGSLPWREVMHLAMQHMPDTKRGRKEPPIPEQLALVEGWHAVRGRMLQQRYCDRVGISRASLNRYERTCRALGLI